MSYGSEAWAALIAQIRRNPADEELWYIAGDYLLEHQDPRGEFLMLCGRLERGVETGYVAMYERRAELAATHPWTAAQLAEGFPEPREVTYGWSSSSQMMSAFIERLEVADEAMLARLPHFCRFEPITELTCWNLGVVALAELREIYALELDESSWALLASPQLANVRRLRTDVLGDPQARALAASVLRPHFIEVSDNDASGFALLAGSPALTELRRLPIAEDHWVAALNGHPLPALVELDTTKLSYPSLERLASNLGQLGMATLTPAATPLVIAHAPRLRELVLLEPGADVAQTNALIDSAACLHVEKLAMRGVPFADVENALRRLAVHGHLKELTIDGTRGRTITIAGVRVIEAQPYFAESDHPITSARR